MKPSQPMVMQMTFIAQERAPREACGFVLVGGAVVEVTNIAKTDEHFHMDPEEQMRWWDDAIAIWHSHPRGDPTPSDLDISMQLMAYDRRTMVIVNLDGACTMTTHYA